MTEPGNALLEYWSALGEETPAKLWADAPVWHDATDRALGIDRNQEGGLFAVYPFRLARIADQWRILAAWPCPRILGPVDDDHLDIETVLAWEPRSNTVEVLGDAQAQIVGRFDPYHGNGKTGYLYGQARPFFQAWAHERARFYGFARQCAGDARPDEPDLVPGCLIVGDPAKVRWRPGDMPKHVECIGCKPAEINRAMLRSLKLPRFASSMRAAA